MSISTLQKNIEVSGSHHGSQKAALWETQKVLKIMILGGLLGTFWRSDSKSENGALAYMGASKSHPNIDDLFDVLLKAMPSTSPGAICLWMFLDFEDFGGPWDPQGPPIWYNFPQKNLVLNKYIKKFDF